MGISRFFHQGIIAADDDPSRDNCGIAHCASSATSSCGKGSAEKLLIAEMPKVTDELDARLLIADRHSGSSFRLRTGQPRQIHYIRFLKPTRRHWVDDALFQHATHPVDTLFHWFDDLRPCGGAGSPLSKPFADICLAARLPNDAPVGISISYSSAMPQFRLTLVGEKHTVMAHGFESIESDDASLSWTGNAAAAYPEAIAAQDRDFLKACAGGGQAFRWTETARIIERIDRFKLLCAGRPSYQS